MRGRASRFVPTPCELLDPFAFLKHARSDVSLAFDGVMPDSAASVLASVWSLIRREGRWRWGESVMPDSAACFLGCMQESVISIKSGKRRGSTLR